MPARTPSEATTKFESLPLAKILALLDAITIGDLGAAAKHGGGITRAALADLQPSGETGLLLDALEKRALFLLSRKAGLVVMRALPAAAETLAAIAQGPSCEGDIEAGMDASDVPLVDPALAPHEQEAVQRKVMHEIAKSRVPNPKNLEQKRLGALALIDLAKTLDLFTLAKEYREPDRAETDEVELQRMAEQQGLGDLSSYAKPEQTLRSVK